MRTRVGFQFSSRIFIFQLNETSVFSFSVDTKFLITKDGSFFKLAFSDFNYTIKRWRELALGEKFNASNE